MNLEQKKVFLKNLLGFHHSFYQFCFECLGYKNLNRVHKDLCSFIQNDSNKFKLILMPRYSFKSSIVTIGYSLWSLIRNPNERILIYSDASSKAEGFLDSIKAHIEGKNSLSRFREFYPKWESDIKSGKWNKDQIVVSKRSDSYPEPSVDTGGIETSKVGFHYGLIIFDDIVSDVNNTTKDQMDKVANCYKKALSLLKPNGHVVITGTRWHFGDLYGRLIAENSVKNTFGIFVVDGEKDPKYGEFCFSDIGDNSLTAEFLARQKQEQGSMLYSCLYRNNPCSDETAVFAQNKFSFYGDIKKDDLYITLTCDPAGEGEDFTAIVVVGTDHGLNMHILEVVNAHLKPSGIIEEIIRLQYKYQFAVCGIETNFFRGMLELELKGRRDEEHRLNPDKFRMFGVQEFDASTRKGGKHARIMALQPYHEKGAIKFPGERIELLQGAFSELAWQMFQYTNDGAKSPHDDAIDALAYHIPLIRKGGVAKPKEPPVNSPAWLERRYFEELTEKNFALPRRMRRALPEMAFN